MATALIAGGGIGGLTAALCLARQGWQVEVHEQAPVIAEVGAGIQLSPNCSRILLGLGLGPRLAGKVVQPAATVLRHHRTGNALASHPLGATATTTYGAPYWHVHRADLLAALLAATEAHASITLHTGHTATGCLQASGQTALLLADGQVHGDLLIGADGIHSSIRKALFGPDKPRFTGNLAWRATVPVADLPPDLVPPNATVWLGPGRHLVHYRVRGGSLVNLVAVAEQRNWRDESWVQPADPAEIRQAFAGWHPDVQALLEQLPAADCHRWALHDRLPLPNWGRGHVTLLGDACHPTLPFLAQGAAMAIEDAAVLATCLGPPGQADIATALQTYAALRQPRTARVQATSRRNARIFHLRGPLAWARNLVLQPASRGAMDWLYRHNAEA